MSKEKISVLFQPSGRRGEVETGKSVLEAARELGVTLESVCGGKATCGKCRVRIDSRPASPGPEILSPFTFEEGKFINEDERKAGYRLACAARLSGDAMVYLPEESRGFQQVIRKEAREISLKLNPAIKSYYLEFPPPTLEEPLADFERLQRALSASYGLKDLRIDYPALQALPHRLRSADWKVTVLIWMDREIIDLRPGRLEDFYGAALDIGTTTVALYLCSLRTGKVVAAGSMMNPQVNYGEDVMARITYCMMNPGEGLSLLRGAILDGLNGLIQSSAASAGICAEDLLEITVVGNTAMHHLFLGIDPQPLGLSPFPPAVHRALDLKARDIGVKIHPAANVHLLPNEAGFVGADNVGVLIAEEPYRREEMSLIIDVGTNGELVLGNRRRLLSSSCATGPAFEGAHIRFGMRAAPGAIEKVRILPGTMEVKYKIIGREEWSDECSPGELQVRGICGSGIIDAVAEMFRAGVLDKSGRIHGTLNTRRLRKAERGFEFVLAWAEETAIGQDITVSTSDVRAVQLAKGALYSGAKIMMKTLGLERVDRVVLAGGFGSYIDPERAMILGMFPDCDLANVVSAGNAAGDGARMALLSREKRAEAERIAREVEYVELTVAPDFTMEFAEAMAFPHQKDPFRHLESLLSNRKVE